MGIEYLRFMFKWLKVIIKGELPKKKKYQIIFPFMEIESKEDEK